MAVTVKKPFDAAGLRGRAAIISGSDCVEVNLASACPFEVRARGPVSLAAWLAGHRVAIERDLLRSGAILFRGFDIASREAFEAHVASYGLPLMHYMEGATPRTQLSEHVYTSTEFPRTEAIALHNELTYVRHWPTRLWFCCVQRADEGGETPIADVRKVYARIDPALRQVFAERGWMLVRNYAEHLGSSWRRAFRTENREAVEEYCRGADVTCEWLPNGQLRTRQVRDAIVTHPITSEPVWFNHVAFWHVSSLDEQTREVMLRDLGESGLPYNTYFGNGTPIDDADVEAVRAAYRAETIVFPWNNGDVLMLDNVLVAHGRQPFRGERRVLVAMAGI